MHVKIFVVLAVAALTGGQRRYYSLEDMPETSFDCRDKILGGYYADPEANCQMFHVCVKTPGQGVQDFRFLCPNETAFDQENQVCADSGDIDCQTSGFYLQDFDLYRLGSAQAKLPVRQLGDKKIGAIPIGPSTKSPILTNNIYEDDDFYLQKSETGDRRLQSKELFRGSSSSNFFNNRNKGKDLEEDDEEASPKKQENTSNNQLRIRPSFSVRPKTQYQSQLRKTDSPSTATTQQSVVENQLNTGRKRTKIAIRKLARKRPEDETEVKTTQLPELTSFATQKFGFGDSNSRYNIPSRLKATPVTFGASEGLKQKQQQSRQPAPTAASFQKQRNRQNEQQRIQLGRFQNFQNSEQSTLAFFEPGPTSGGITVGSERKVQVQAENKETTPFGLFRNPIVAAAPTIAGNQNRGSANGLQQNRQTTADHPQPVSSGKTGPSGDSEIQQQPSRQSLTTASFSQRTQGRQPAATTAGFSQQQQTRRPPTTSAFTQQQQNRQPVPTASSFPQQHQGRPPSAPTAGFPQQRQSKQSVSEQQQNVESDKSFQLANNGNFQFQHDRQSQSKVVPNGISQNGVSTSNKQQSSNGPQGHDSQQGFDGQGSRVSDRARQAFSLNADDSDDGDDQGFLKTATTNNFRPSDFNSFAKNSNYKSEGKNGAATVNFSEASSTKYVTPMIVTTARATPTYDTPPPRLTSSVTSSSHSTVATSQKTQFTIMTITPPPSPPPTTSSSKSPQRIYPSSTAAGKTVDVAYDYAYYDDTGPSFSDYSSFDNLGESADFSRTSQRAKSRLI